MEGWLSVPMVVPIEDFLEARGGAGDELNLAHGDEGVLRTGLYKAVCIVKKYQCTFSINYVDII